MFKNPNKCPWCATDGKKWKTNPDIFKCPACNAVFSEFGLVNNGQNVEMSFN